MSHPYRLALLLVTLSGWAALSHQLLWTRRMIDLLGATTGATARVIGCFFLGLALGGALATPLVRKVRRPWRAIARVEIGVAIAVLPALTLTHWSDWIWPALGVERLIGWQGSAVKMGLSIAVVLPPAILMGMVLPFAGRAVLANGRTLGREGVWLYAMNTLGAAIGLVIVTAVLIPTVGVYVSMVVAAMVNVVIAFVALVADRRFGQCETIAPHVPDDSTGAAAESHLSSHTRTRSRNAPYLVALLSGACVLAIEVLAIHLFNQVVWLSIHSAAAVLFVVIIMLALAAMVAPRLVRNRSPAIVLANLLAASAVVTVIAPFLFFSQTDGLTPLTPSGGNATAYLARVVVLGLAAFGPCVFVSGLVLPVTFVWFSDVQKDSRGRLWGLLLAANGVGGIVGAEVANHSLMPMLGMHTAMGAIAVLYALAAVCLGLLEAQNGSRTKRVAAIGAIVVICIATQLPTLQLIRPDTWRPNDPGPIEIVEQVAGSEGIVAVVDHGPERMLLLNNQYRLGAQLAARRQEQLGIVPILLHPAPRHVAFIGLATGGSAGAALADEQIQSVTAIELSPLVVAMATKHFTAMNRDIGNDPRATIVVEDGRTFIAASRDRFDVIVGDLFIPWESGTGRLYCLEHFAAAKAALRDGGVFCQWAPMFQLTPEQFHIMAATFAEVFDDVYLVRDDAASKSPAFGIVGLKNRKFDWSIAHNRAVELQGRGLIDQDAYSDAEKLGQLYIGRYRPTESATFPMNTLDNAWLELDAGRRYIAGEWTYLGPETYHLLPDYLGPFDQAAP